jgi:hypothetical protein
LTLAGLLMGVYSEGVASLNDMKDMLANLPQYQEQREKVRFFGCSSILFFHTVFFY